MTGLLNAILLGAGLSVLAATLIWLLARRFDTALAGHELGVWRAARYVALLPVLLAPVIYAIPQYEPVVAGVEGGLFADIPVAATTLPPVDASDAGFTAIALSASQMAVLVYLAGLVLALGLAVYRHAWRARILRESREPNITERAVMDRYAGTLGVRAPEMRISEHVVSPFITGWRSVVVVPASLFEDPKALRFALVHELTHMRRGDERDRLIGAALMAVFWFNWPLRWIEHNLGQARELACDAECLDALGRAERKSYAAALIDMMRSAAQPVSAFGPDDRRHREMRIKAILSGQRKTGSSLARLGLIAGAAIMPVACAQAALTERTSIAQPVEAVAFFGEADPRRNNRVVRFGPDVREGNRAFGPGVVTDPQTNMRFGPEPSADVPLAQPVEPVLEGLAEPRVAPVVEPAPAVAPQAVAAPHPHAEPRPAVAVAPEVSPDIDVRLAAATAVAPAAIVSLDTHVDHHVAPDVSADVATTVPDFSHRVTDGRVTSHFGHRPSRPAGSPVHHRGTDIAAPTGTPIWAPSGGTVVHAQMGYNGSDRWGNTVVIDHGNGWQTAYAHMHRIDVEVGDTVAAGAQLGQIGSTGASTGPHVHVELRHGGEVIDPANHLPGLR